MTDPKPPPPPKQAPQRLTLEYGTFFWVVVFAVTLGVAAGTLLAHYVQTVFPALAG